MKNLDLVDKVVNYIPDKCTDMAFRMTKDPEGLFLNAITPQPTLQDWVHKQEL